MDAGLSRYLRGAEAVRTGVVMGTLLRRSTRPSLPCSRRWGSVASGERKPDLASHAFSHELKSGLRP